jgi:hypothetical protein
VSCGPRIAPASNRKEKFRKLIPAMTASCFQLRLYCGTALCPLGAPGLGLPGPLAQSTFVDEDEGVALVTGLFSSAGVLSSVGESFATAPTSKASRSSFFCVAPKPPGRPNDLRHHACGYSANTLARLDALCQMTPSISATSACATSRASIRIPARRRPSSSIRSRWCRVVIVSKPRSVPTSIKAHKSRSLVIQLVIHSPIPAIRRPRTALSVAFESTAFVGAIRRPWQGPIREHEIGTQL